VSAASEQNADPLVMKALIIREPWIDRILAGDKTWEMRSRTWKHTGPLALIRAGSKQVVGMARMVNCRTAITDAVEFAKAERFHAILPSEQADAFRAGWTTPWVLAEMRRLDRPVPYAHTSQVDRVNLQPDEAAKVLAQLRP